MFPLCFVLERHQYKEWVMIKKKNQKNKTFSLYKRKSRYWFIVASNTAGQSLTGEENGSNLRETLPYERHLLKSLPLLVQ